MNIIGVIILFILEIIYFILYGFYQNRRDKIQNKKVIKIMGMLYEKEILPIIVLLSLSSLVYIISILTKSSATLLALALILLISANILFFKKALREKETSSILFAFYITILLIIIIGSETTLIITRTKSKSLFFLGLGSFIITSGISIVMMSRDIKKTPVKILLLSSMYLLVLIIGGWIFGSYYYLNCWKDDITKDFLTKEPAEVLTILAIHGAKPFFNYPDKLDYPIKDINPIGTLIMAMIQFLFGLFLNGVALASIFTSLLNRVGKSPKANE